MLCIISIYNYKILSMIMKKIILLTVVSFAAIIARAQSFHYYPLNPNRSLENDKKLFLMTAIRKTALYMLDS